MRARLALSFRLARREVVRHPWRTTLVVLLVMLPTAAMAAVTVGIRTSSWSATDQFEASWGQADAVSGPFYRGADDQSVEDLLAALPPGSRLVVERRLADRVTIDGARVYVELSDLPVDDDIARGRFASIEGKASPGAGEVVLDATLADELGVSLGDAISPERLDRDLTVVGLTHPERLDAPAAYVASLPELRLVSTTVLADVPGRPFLLADRAVTDYGYREPTLPASLSPLTPAPPPSSAMAIFWTFVLGGVALIVVGIVVAAAFAVGARRQLHSLGLLASAGASPGLLRRTLVAQGALAGFLGAAAGVVAVAVTARLVPADLVSEAVGHRVEGARIVIGDLVGIVALGTVIAAGAASLPARSAAKVPTLQALAGRRPLRAVPAVVPVLGAVAIVGGSLVLAGAAMATLAGDGYVSNETVKGLVAVFGALAVLGGTCAVAPWAVSGMERLVAGRSTSLRLAGRSLARNRVRSAAIVAAICAVAAVCVAGSTLAASVSSRQYEEATFQGYAAPLLADGLVVAESAEMDSDALVGRVQTVLPGSTAVPVDRTQVGDIGIANPGMLDLFDVPADLRAALDEGALVRVAAPGRASYVEEGVGYLAGEVVQAGGARPELLDLDVAATIERPAASMTLPLTLIGPATAERVGLVDLSQSQVVDVGRPLAADERADLSRLREDIAFEQVDGGFEQGAGSQWIELPDDFGSSMSEAMVRAILLGIAFALMLGVVVVGLSLAATDNRDETLVLSAVGASPVTTRRVGALRALLLPATAVAIAVPTGLFTAGAVVLAFNVETTYADMPLRVDPVTLAFVVLVVPAASGLLTWLAASVRDRVRRHPPALRFDPA